MSWLSSVSQLTSSVSNTVSSYANELIKDDPYKKDEDYQGDGPDDEAAMMQRIQSLESQNERYQNELQRMHLEHQQKLQESTRQINELQARIANQSNIQQQQSTPTLSPQQPSNSSSTDALQSKLNQAVALLKRLKDDNAALTLQKANIEAKANQQTMSLQSEIQHLKIELEAIQATDLQDSRPKTPSSSLEAEVVMLRQLSSERAAREEVLQRSVGDLQAKLAAALGNSKSEDTMKAELERLRADHVELEKLRADNIALNQQLTIMASERDVVSNEKDSLLADADKRHDSLRTERDQLEQALVQANQQIPTILEQLKHLQQVKQSDELHLAKLQNENRELSDRITAQQEIKQGDEQRLVKLEHDNRELLERLQAVQVNGTGSKNNSQTNLDLDLKIAMMEEENSNLTSKLAELEQSIVAEKSNYESRLSQLETSNREAINARDIAQDKLDEVEKALDELVASHEEELQQLVAKDKKARMEDSAKIHLLEGQLKQLQDATSEQLMRVTKDMDERIAALTAERDAAIEASNNNSSNNDSSVDHESVISELQHTISSLSNENRTYKMDVEASRKKLEADLEASKQQNEDSAAQIHKLEADLIKLSHISEELSASESERNALSRQVETLRHQIQESESTWNSKHVDESSVWQKRVAELEEVVTQLRLSVEQTRAVLHDREDDLATHIDLAHRRENELTERIQELEATPSSSDDNINAPHHSGRVSPSVDVLVRVRQEDAAIIASLNQDIELLRDEMVREKRDSDDRIAETRRRLQQAVEIGKKKAAEVEELKRVINELPSNLSANDEDTQKQLEEVYQVLEARGRELSEARLSASRHAQEAEAYKTRMEEFESERHSRLDKIKEYELENHELRQQIAVLERQVEGFNHHPDESTITRSITPATDAISETTTAAVRDTKNNVPASLVIDLLTSLSENRQVHVDVDGIDAAYTTLQAMISDMAASSEQHSREMEKLQRDHVSVVEEWMHKASSAEEERKRMETERSMIMDRMTNMKNAIAPKLQAEMDESNRLRQQVASLSTQHAQLSQTLAQYQQERDSLFSERDSLASQLASLTESLNTMSAQSTTSSSTTQKLEQELDNATHELEKYKRDMARLKAHLLETEESFTRDSTEREAAVSEYSRRVAELESERDSWSAIVEELRNDARSERERCEEASEMSEVLREEMVVLKEGLRSKEEALGNLQSVLAEFQAAKDSEIEFALDGMRRQLAIATKNLQDMKKRCDDAEAKLVQSEDAGPEISRLGKELSERNEQVGKLRHTAVQLQNHLNEALRRMRDATSAEDAVDRRLVSSLVVNFCAAPRAGADKTRYEILRVMDGILKFTEEERWKVGLGNRPRDSVTGSDGGGRSPGGVGGTPERSASESFTDMWISFLLRESQVSTKPPTSTDGSSAAAPSAPTPQ
ncbi:hypothetical protein SmJEL517_g04071 [Synchytrium microbalum]|uniref:GRIP domain-containing protein n=1 Tax=Synchytrium microbalum TaxID=1806994 RepID=A0A507BTL3_9FUNG|nr:uncharacterized protein SmJEL517_g04071 [Synchytrium microbalum]TPX32880.1 hypothetical protein SmJEL517_g04071 [Synchytrium microbalum]